MNRETQHGERPNGKNDSAEVLFRPYDECKFEKHYSTCGDGGNMERAKLIDGVLQENSGWKT